MTRFIEFEGGDVEIYLRSQEQKDLLRFITCGSVDDGKSTLIGRLLYEAKMLFEDQLSAPLKVTQAPPSWPQIIRSGSRGSIQRS